MVNVSLVELFMRLVYWLCLLLTTGSFDNTRIDENADDGLYKPFYK